MRSCRPKGDHVWALKVKVPGNLDPGLYRVGARIGKRLLTLTIRVT